MRLKQWGLIALAVALALPSFGADIPQPSGFDVRVRYVDYRKDDVTVVYVQRGSVTRIVLADEEKIVAAATGFAADCSKDALEWCVRADAGWNQIWVKPKDGATFNNLELKTDQRDYSFEFRLLSDVKGRPAALPDPQQPAQPMFRVIFRYPVPTGTVVSLGAGKKPLADSSIVDQRVAGAKPEMRNSHYTMQVMKGGQDIAPSLVFDDGRFTYFRFANNREVPTIFLLSPSGEEARVNFEMEGDLAVVQRMGRRFVLRLGKAVVGVWNEAFDADGVGPVEGTTVGGVDRTLRVDPTGSGSHP